MEKDLKPVEVKIKTQEIELPKLDLTKYVGKREIIQTVSTLKGKFGYFVRLETTPVDVLQRKEDVLEVKASRIFGLYEDKDGKIGWGKETELGMYLQAKKCKHYEELKGKEVIIQIKEKDGKEFLTFV